jgi:alkylation response protein AidB-like acyl-CoA dehydrogenase
VEFMTQERATLQRLLPGFEERLCAMPLHEREGTEGAAIGLFREAGGPGLLVPVEHRGLGISMREGLHVQRAIGSRSPSLAVATTMHHFSTATLVELWRREKGLEWMLLQGIAEQRLLLASGFAEGVHGRGVLRPTMRGRRENGAVIVSGVKRPCSLARTMDILTASVVIEDERPDHENELAVALISSRLPGIEVNPFWGTSVLAGAQSDAVTLTDVAVENDLVVSIGSASDPHLDALQMAGFLWFELLITASYLGAASALVEMLLNGKGGDAIGRIAAAGELEATMASLEGVAHAMEEREHPDERLLARALLCRYAAQDAINRAVAIAVEQLGGMAFIRSDEVTCFAGASRALAFHPPGRVRTAAAIVQALGGGELRIE